MRALRQLYARAVDVADPILVALLAGTALIEVLVTGAPLVEALIVAVIALPLLARRRAPLLVLVLVIAAGYAGPRYSVTASDTASVMYSKISERIPRPSSTRCRSP